MTHDVPESDWRTFRDLRELALDRFCKRVLEQLEELSSDASRTHHERYRDVFRLLQDRDREIARAFDNPRRSTMLMQLAAIDAHALLEPHEIARFTPGTRARIGSLAQAAGRTS